MDSQQGSLLGPQFSSAEIRAYLERKGIPYRRAICEANLLAFAAQALADGKVVGWFRGRMEFGPRALGSRSIVADPRRPEMQARLNDKIKLREGFRPFAPAVLAEQASAWFDPRRPGS
jgi:carbamoyltransferase